jgi:hypothetical protein
MGSNPIIGMLENSTLLGKLVRLGEFSDYEPSRTDAQANTVVVNYSSSGPSERIRLLGVFFPLGNEPWLRILNP